MLEIRNLVVQIEDNRILNGLDLSVRRGEVAAIMGPNGSGKSTLSYVIAGKEDYEVLEGEILLEGETRRLLVRRVGPDRFVMSDLAAASGSTNLLDSGGEREHDLNGLIDEITAFAAV